MLKNITIFSSDSNCIFGLENVEIWFSLFLEKLKRIEFSLKNTNTYSIEIFSRNLQPKYEVGAEDNTNSASSSTFF